MLVRIVRCRARLICELGVNGGDGMGRLVGGVPSGDLSDLGALH